MPPVHDHTFTCMGTEMRVLVEPAGSSDPHDAGRRAEALLREFDARLSRFAPVSDLSSLNADPRPTVAAGIVLRTWVRAALWAAQRSGGLVDPTMIDALEEAGYRASCAGRAPADIVSALRDAPAPAAARGSKRQAWRAITVDDGDGTISRPPGLRLDSGGTGKGLAADVAARLLRGAAAFVVDCGGDIAVGGTAGHPREIEIRHPLSGASTHQVALARGAVATSGIDRRIWRDADGQPAHHLLDPATGRPAWTGLISVSVVASTVLEAETLAKAALLSGPAGARRVLSRHAAVLFDAAGDTQVLTPRPGLRVAAHDLLGAAA